jgi:propionyl-CoA synthetase
VRDAGGHAVGLSVSIKSTFGIRGPGDVIFCASDIGWVVGHSYILYAPLLVGATTVLFEGKPVGTPDAGTFWRVVERNKVNVLFTAPTALRAIRRDDPENKFLAEVGARGGLKSLKALFLAGERSEPGIVQSYQDLLSQWAAPGALVVDNWWSSETGSPITGLALNPELAMPFSRPEDRPEDRPALPRIKPGSAGKPLPGFDVRIVDDAGHQVSRGVMGNIVLATPLAPTAFTTLFNDRERFYNSYLRRFDGKWLDTGDAGMVDQDGYVHVMARSDDIINVAAHRFSTGLPPSPLMHDKASRLTEIGAIEQAILTHPAVSEASVVGMPDALKGHMPFAFVHLKSTTTNNAQEEEVPATPPASLFNEINAIVRAQIGAIASLGGLVQGYGMIPKTRSGKTVRRVLRELVENASAAMPKYDQPVSVPPTIEDADVVEVARGRVREYFTERGKKRTKAKL